MLPMLKRKARLLVLDDDVAMQKLMATLLRREGHRVDTVTSGAQAIAELARHDYDGLLLDLMTPTEGGMTVIRHLQETAPEMVKRVVLVTASPDAVLKTASRGVFAVVRKPFEAAELTETIDKLLQQ
jgi:CheY-like chemotaxis protein